VETELTLGYCSIESVKPNCKNLTFPDVACIICWTQYNSDKESEASKDFAKISCSWYQIYPLDSQLTTATKQSDSWARPWASINDFFNGEMH
jgi:hypothetical protein